jgi:signal transduction histidine kinase
MRGRPWSWITGRPRLTDGVVVAFNLLVGTLAFIGNYRVAAEYPLTELFVFAASLSLWLRRRHPEAVVVFIAAAGLTRWLIVRSGEPTGLALAFGMFAVSAYGRQSTRRWFAAGAILLTVTGAGLLLFGLFPGSDRLIPAGAFSLVAWVAGDYMRSRRQFVADLIERQRKIREQAADAERLRIARELHDVVAHNVSAMAIQAGAARVTGNVNDETLESIEQGARETLSELNKLLGVLRKSPGAPELAPQPTLEDVDALLKPARDAGLETTLKVTGEKRPLPAAIDLSAYRIVQEAITNVLKHANASRVEVTVDYGARALKLAIADNGGGPSSTNSGGHGLIGMRERVELFGGDLSTGSSSLGGFTVRATLPVEI